MNRITHQLLGEHQGTGALMHRLEGLLVGHPAGPPELGSGAAAAHLLRELGTALMTELMRHFDFEERALFPLLSQAGEGGLGAQLQQEHAVMRPLAKRLAQLAHAGAAAASFDAASWSEFRRVGAQLCGLLLEHIEREDRGLLPLLEESMDSQTEMRLYDDYVAAG